MVFSKNMNVPPDNLHVLSNIDMVEKDLLQIVGEASPSKPKSEPSHPSFQINLQGNAGSRQVAEGKSKSTSFFADEERRRSLKIASSGDTSRNINAGFNSEDAKKKVIRRIWRDPYKGVSYASPQSLGSLYYCVS